MALTIVVLAAGQGTRMKSTLPKVLHSLAGKPMLQHVLDTAKALEPKKIIVVHGHQGEQIVQAVNDKAITFVEQIPQKGTADALAKALPFFNENESVLILYGDVPLMSAESLKKLIDNTPENSLGLMSAQFENPFGLGRIIRDSGGSIIRIVEQKDATKEQQAITEVNTGIYYAKAHMLQKWLPLITNDNQQREYYLTDIVSLAVKEGTTIVSVSPDTNEVLGVNDREQLAQAERLYQYQQVKALMHQGVSFADPHRCDIRGEVFAQNDVFVDINVIFQGKVTLKQGCQIGPNCVLINCTVGENVTIKANCHLEEVTLLDRAVVGPFARLRPGANIGKEAHIGNFVEVKNATIGEGSKVNHLSYVGDATVGKHVNIGAGTITCNYDGVNKHQTIIEDNVMIGSDTQLIAPVHIGKGATIGAGSTIHKDVPENQLTLTQQLNQRSKTWQRPKKSSENNQ